MPTISNRSEADPKGRNPSGTPMLVTGFTSPPAAKELHHGRTETAGDHIVFEGDDPWSRGLTIPRSSGRAA